MEVNYKAIKKCRVCGNRKLEDILSLGKHKIVEFSKKAIKIPLDLVHCPKCELVQLRHTTKPELLWNENYGYRSGINEKMVEHLHEIAREAEKYVKPEDIVLDIGCNDGTLLNGYTKKLNLTGVDPSENVAKYASQTLDGKSFELVYDFFSSKVYKIKAKVITAISMFYDLDKPNSFVRDLVRCLDHKGVIIIQQNYLLSMLKQNAFDNICHEHLEYYSLTSMINLFKRHGLEIFKVSTNDLNGGSFRTYICRKGERRIELSVKRMLENESKELDYKDFSRKVKNITKYLNWVVKTVIKKGKTVYAYGASTRGGTLLQACKLDHRHIKFAVERNPDKFGKVMHSTGIPIISEAQARKDKPDYMLILPWFFTKTFVKREEEYLNEGTFIIPLPVPYVI